MIANLVVRDERAYLAVGHDVGRYYRSLFLLTFGLKLQRPSQSEHITVISPDDEAQMNFIVGENFSFDIELALYTNGSAIWLPVVSSDIDEMRARLGLGEPYNSLHFCIGYL